MNKKIVIKEIDKLVSSVSKEKIITEYIIYYVVNGIRAEAWTEVGKKNKQDRVNDLILKYFVNNDFDVNWEHREYPIEEILFEDLYNVEKNF